MLGSARNALLVLMFILLTAGVLGAACPEGDLHVDCHIDWSDVQILAEQWLGGAGSEADLIGGDGVDMRDFARLAANWGVTGEPTGSLQVIISPQAAIELGAKWRIDGGVWRDSGELVPDLGVGSYTIEFSVIDTWAEPAEQAAAVVEDLITDIRASYKHPLVINEFMASNSMFVLDPQGQDDDWIEIYNIGEEAIDVGGMHLTDNLGDPTRWRIPDDNPALTSIIPGGYLIIWADNDEHDYPDGLHAGFELSAAGNDEIGLFDSNGTSLIDSVAFPDQTPNISYGRFPDGNDMWRFFPSATAGSENVDAYLGEVADTQFSHNRGFYDTPFSVRIASETEDSVIYYTLDGTEPGKVNGQFYTGVPYTGAIAVNKTSCLRARAVKTGWKPSNADAQTYIFLDDVLAQPAYPNGFPSYWKGTAADYEMDPAILNDSRYRNQMKSSLLSLPVMSIATDVDNLFDSATGIYANPSNHGVAWEKPASVEFFDSAGGEEFQINCGLRIQGGWFRPLNNCRKKSFRLLFKGMYGSTNLTFPLFGKNGVDSFDTITLRAGANDGYSWSDAKYTEQYTRDEFGRSLQLATGHAASRGTFVHLYVNGLYWGLYNPCERPDNSFSASHYGGEKDNWDSIKTEKEVLSGSISAWNQMVAKCSDAASSTSEFQRLQGSNPDGTANEAYPHLLDVPNYIDYLIVNLWAGNWDWPWKNYYMARQQGPQSTGFKFFCWDCENTLGNNLSRSDLNKNALNNSFTHVGEPHTYLRQNAEYRMEFADHIHRLFFNGGILTPTSLTARYSQMADQVELSIISESARWGDQHHHPPLTLEDWYDRDGYYSDGRAGRGWIMNYYLPQRTEVVLQQFRNAGLYPSIDAPVFRINGSYRHGGHISSADSFSIASGTGTIYYTIDGNDPRAPVTSTGDLSTVLVAENAAKHVHVPTDGSDDTTWKSIGFGDLTWSDGTPIITGTTGGVGYDRNSTYRSYITYDVQSEMMDKYTGCYIRIPFSVDPAKLAGFDSMTLKVRYDDGFVAYINGAEADRRNFSGAAAWNSNCSEHSDTVAVVFESIDISDHIADLRAGNNVLAVHGMNKSSDSSDFLISVELLAGESGIPSDSDVSPSAIEYTVSRNFDMSTHVKARLKSGPTWSALNEATYAVGPVAENLRISEIMYHPQETGDVNDPNEEFIELTNVGGETINLSLAALTNGIDFTFGDVYLGVGDYVVVVRDEAAFAAQYPGFSGVIAGEYIGSLNNSGERIELEDAMGQTILNFAYKDGWRSITDGQGYSLTIMDATDSEPNTQDSWRASAYIGGSPGYDDSGVVPNPGEVVINEIMAHSHAAAPDWIELYNATDAEIDIGGWYLSDSDTILKKYHFAADTKIGAYSYLLLHEDLNFGDGSSDPGKIVGFAFSENGDEAHLSSAEADVLTGYRAVESFGASYTGISFGRYYKSGTNNYNFVPMDHNTPGMANAYPAVGPIVISEIMYNPDWPGSGSYGNDRYEFVELENITGEAVTLYRSDKNLSWKFSEGIDYIFPDWPDEVTIAAGDRIVVVRDVDAFTERYPSVPAAKIFGPYEGQLSNAGEQLELSMPGDIDKFGRQHYIRIDRVTYSDGSHHDDVPGGVDLWPVEPDGGGHSLNRITAELYGNDPNNWTNAAPSAGN